MKASLIFAFFAALIMTETESEPQINVDTVKDETAEKLLRGIQRFSFTFLLRSSLSLNFEDMFVSPYSAWYSLTLMCKAAKGDTLRQLVKFLSHPKKQYNQTKENLEIVETTYNFHSFDPDIKLRSFIITDQKVFEDFQRSITSSSKMYVISTKFQDSNASRIINREFSEATDGQLGDVVNQNDLKDSQIILANAVFFKTAWKHPFNPMFTSKERFYDHTNKQIGVVDMMMQKGRYKYAKVDSFQADVIEMQIGDKNMCMLTIMPYPNVELKTIYNNFVHSTIDDIFDALEKSGNHHHDVEVQFPKFTMITDLILNQVLFEMGIDYIFDPLYADLTGLFPTKNVSVSRIIHLAKIEVVEGGEAIGVDIVSRFDDRIPRFVVNRPFLYFVIEKETNVVVLGGTFKDP